jgi:hypothetical protein
LRQPLPRNHTQALALCSLHQSASMNRPHDTLMSEPRHLTSRWQPAEM